MRVSVNGENRELHVYDRETGILAVQQESEDMLFALKDAIVKEEWDNYLYEETKYMTTTLETIQMENICVKELKEALETGNQEWLTENHFFKTAEKMKK